MGFEVEEPTFDVKLGDCFNISVEEAIIIEVTYNFNRGIFASATGCLKRIFGIFLGYFKDIFEHLYIEQHCMILTFLYCVEY